MLEGIFNLCLVILIIQIFFIVMGYRHRNSIMYFLNLIHRDSTDLSFDKYIRSDIQKLHLDFKRYVKKGIVGRVYDSVKDIRYKDLRLINSDLLIVMNMVRYLQDDIDLIINNNPELKKLREKQPNYDEREREIVSDFRKYPKRYENIISVNHNFYDTRENYEKEMF